MQLPLEQHMAIANLSYARWLETSMFYSMCYADFLILSKSNKRQKVLKETLNQAVRSESH